MQVAETSGLSAFGDKKSWRRRIRSWISLHLRQVPCLDAIVPAFVRNRCSRSEKYQSLGQDEERDNGGALDHRQNLNQNFGIAVTRIAMIAAIAIVVKFIATQPGVNAAGEQPKQPVNIDPDEEFKKSSPMILYMAAVIELLTCGACAITAASMYRRRRHQITHPADSDERAKRGYLEVHLSKTLGMEESETYGLGFRPSSDGLECLLVESIRMCSPLDQWNSRQMAPTPEELVEEALGMSPTSGNGDDVEGPAKSEDAAASTHAPSPMPNIAVERRRRHQQVEIGSAIVAVNAVAGDVGMMQLELLKPRVTLWVRDVFIGHASQFEDHGMVPAVEETPGGTFPRSDAPIATGGAPPRASSDVVIGRPIDGPEGGIPDAQQGPRNFNNHSLAAVFNHIAGLMGGPPLRGPCCACVALEDEEPQILMRWLTCSLLFGWVTMLPVLFTHPHESRPRQHLFRQFLLKPCLIVMFIWILLWFLDCIQVVLSFKIIHPFYYFGILHMVLPGILAWYLLHLQAADERLVLEQRADREKQSESRMPFAIEDPAPTLLKELIMMNPVALVWLGACVSIPIVIFSFFAPMKTDRGKLAQGFVNLMYTPMILFQCAFAYVLWYSSFEKLPELYMAGLGLLLSVQCFLIWCACIVCSSRYGRRDLALVVEQRLRRAKAAKDVVDPPSEEDPQRREIAPLDLVDCTEAQNREWELIYSA